MGTRRRGPLYVLRRDERSSKYHQGENATQNKRRGDEEKLKEDTKEDTIKLIAQTRASKKNGKPCTEKGKMKGRVRERWGHISKLQIDILLKAYEPKDRHQGMGFTTWHLSQHLPISEKGQTQCGGVSSSLSPCTSNLCTGTYKSATLPSRHHSPMGSEQTRFL